MQRIDAYNNGVVLKPWGSEYLMFQNEQVALWHLRIRAGERTSLHCHPRKKTALILIKGTATVHFLNNTSILRSPANTMIRPGLFHATHADHGMDIDLIELETPVDKTNIVRLEDAYGRASQPYESLDHVTPLNDQCIRLPNAISEGESDFRFCNMTLVLFRYPELASQIDRLHPQDIVVVLEDGLYAEEEPVLVAGDAVSGATVKRLAPVFATPRGIAGLIVRRVE